MTVMSRLLCTEHQSRWSEACLIKPGNFICLRHYWMSRTQICFLIRAGSCPSPDFAAGACFNKPNSTKVFFLLISFEFFFSNFYCNSRLPEKLKRSNVLLLRPWNRSQGTDWCEQPLNRKFIKFLFFISTSWIIGDAKSQTYWFGDDWTLSPRLKPSQFTQCNIWTHIRHRAQKQS